jgi:hypothetical protein
MEVLILLIKLLLRGAKQNPTASGSPMSEQELIAKIRQRIEAARVDAGTASPRSSTSQPKRVVQNAPRSVQSPKLRSKGIFQQRGKKRPAPPPPLPQAAASDSSVEAVQSTVLPTPAVAASQARETPTVDAKALAVWLRPQLLRKQFILTEILQPPVALRDAHLI